MTDRRILIVEGRDDEMLIGNLLQHYSIKGVNIKRLDGGDKKKIGQQIDVILKASKTSGVTALGIILDADADVLARWQSLVAILTGKGYLSLPATPDPKGFVTAVTAHPDNPRLGIWLMPDNQTSGILEDFAAQLVQDGDALWAYATDTLAALPEQRFAAKDRSKAHIHTWLAWQDEPGKPLGQALLVTYLKAEQPTAVPFIDWIKRLFPEYVS